MKGRYRAGSQEVLLIGESEPVSSPARLELLLEVGMQHDYSDSDTLTEATGTRVLDLPPPPKWSFCLEPDGNILFNVASAPNFIHRFLQRIILGVRWKRIEEAGRF